MPTTVVKSVILDEGATLINGALTGYSRFAPHSFKIGDQAGFTPVATDSDVSGSTVFVGNSNYIHAKAVDSNTVQYTMVVPEGEGPFDVGNIVMFAASLTNEPLAIVKCVLPFTIPKKVSDPNLSNGSPFPKPGGRLIISVTLSHRIVGDVGDTNITVQVLAPSFASMPYYPDELSVPPVLTQPWNQFVLHNHTQIGTPALVTKRADQSYWAMPVFQNLRHPKFGHIVGGHVGDGYQTDQHAWVWGHKYSTPNNRYKGQIGGHGYQNLTVYEPRTIGGAPYRNGGSEG